MKIAIRYQSRGGNTRAAAEVIGNSLGITAESIDEPLDEKVDVLFLGGGAYAWDADPKLKEYLKTLDPKKIGKIAAFTTTGVMKVVLDRITEYANEAGIKVCEEQLCLRMAVKGHSTFGLKGGNLKEKQIEKIKAFAYAALKE